MLVVFLPPWVYGASIVANFSDLRAGLRALTLNTVAFPDQLTAMADAGAPGPQAHRHQPPRSARDR